ncbi:hypothetical protein niasHT_009222 [Heterodera trifolii]|uniref:F-box domain-containing protein n=1 Tax=Heterodera trifolii TaxID=157864 RepID=A0ABD2LYQ9_9BILA
MNKNKKYFLPPELFYELINFLPFKPRWGTTRVSSNFDHFLLGKQHNWLKKIYFSATRLNCAAGQLFAAVAFVNRTTLYQIIGDIAREVGLPFTTGLTDAQLMQNLSDYYNLNTFRVQLFALRRIIIDTYDTDQILNAAIYIEQLTNDFNE